ncbi:MAG: Bcr/CflA family efflux MFS transporter [Gammaproteobacteria bacterium]
MNTPPDSPAPPPRWLIANLLAAISYGLLSMTVCLPSMPQWTILFAATQAEVQLTFSSFVVAFGGAQLVYGPRSDRYGRRRLLGVGFLLALVGSLAGAYADSLAALVVARFVQGTGAAAGMVLGRAMVQDFFSAAERPRMMAYTGMILGVCPPLATLVGGQLHVQLGWRANFLLAALVAALLLVTTHRALPADVPRRSAGRHWLGEFFAAYVTLLRLRSFLGYSAMLAMCTGTFYAFLAGAPVVLAGYGVGPATIGWFIMFPPSCYILGNFLVSRLVRRISDDRLMLLGQLTALCGIGIVLVLALADVRSPFAVAAPLALLGLGHGLMMPSTLAGTVSLVPALAGAAAAGGGLAQQLFGAVGGYLVGLVPHDSAVNLALLMGLFMSLSLVSQRLLLPRPRGGRH